MTDIPQLSDEDLLASFIRNDEGDWSAIKELKLGPWTVIPGIWWGRGSGFSGFIIKNELDAAARRRPDLVLAV